MRHYVHLIIILLLFIPIYFLLPYQLSNIVLGSFIPVSLLYLLNKYIKLDEFDEIEYRRKRPFKFAFYKQQNWEQNKEILKKNQILSIDDQQIYPDNFIINDTLNNIIGLILRDFVEKWYSKISDDETFIISLKHEFGYVFKILYKRLEKVDFANLTVHTFIPILNDHVEKFLVAQEITKNKKIVNKSPSIEKRTTDVDDDSTLASNYNRGKLHSGIKLDSNNFDYDTSIYLSSLINKVLPYLIESNELKSTPVRVLLRELLSSCVLKPIFSMLADPDFYNQFMISILTKQIKDRNDVKKLRHILRRHSMNFNQPSFTFVSDLFNYKLTLETSFHEFDILLKIIQSTKDKESLFKYKIYVLLQNEKIMKCYTNVEIEESKILQKYIKRSNKLFNTIDYNLTNLNSDITNKDNTETASLVSIQSEILKSINKDFSLHEILSSSTNLTFFTTFMQNRDDRQCLLDFWLSAENLRNPLEFSTQMKEKPMFSKIDSTEEDEESSDDEVSMFLDKDLTQESEIKMIFDKYFNLPVMKIPPNIYYKVSEFIEGDHKSVLAYSRARKNILKLQDFEYSRMSKSDFVAFKNTDLWLRLLVEKAVGEYKLNKLNNIDIQNLLSTSDAVSSSNNIKTSLNNSYFHNEISGDPLAKYAEKENAANYIDVNVSGKVSEKVVKAVEEALNEIMKDSDKVEEYVLNNKQEKRNSRLVSDEVAKDIFGNDSESLFGNAYDDTENDSFKKSTDDAMDSSIHDGLEDSASVESEITKEFINEVDSNDLKIAGPNALNLTTEIERLKDEICKLEEQQLIINALLKKAEIINNVPESRVLKKSLISLEKELKLKLLQKEQYIVQESENSLFQRSIVSIPSYISAKDKDGRKFIMYVIKVIKLSQSDPNNITATWMVTRRFSQFYELHNYLKSKFSELNNIEFPKRKVVMKFIQTSVLEERQKKLKIYLQELIKNENVCSDKIFRDFLSSETFDASFNGTLQNVRQNSDGSGTKLYNIISSQALYPLLSLTNYKNINDQDENKLSEKRKTENYLGIMNLEENIAQNENKSKEISFIKPICDLIISVFHLNSATSWLRGKALILLFQQLFGSTLEKILRTNIDGKFKQEENVSQILIGLQSKLWPDGNFKKSSPPRTTVEKFRTKHQTRVLLHIFLGDITSKIFGQTAANDAAETLYAIFQNEILNRHLLLMIMDECFYAIFPEISE
jgi:sorting nexin-25